MLRGARSSHPCYSRGRGYDSRRAVCEPKSIMVAVSRLAPVGGYSVPPPYVFPRFYHQILLSVSIMCPTPSTISDHTTYRGNDDSTESQRGVINDHDADKKRQIMMGNDRP